ncbi:hypothetical protein C7E18_24500, partial [Stenotrophomonas maltophilia]
MLALLMLVPAAIAAALQWPRVGLHARDARSPRAWGMLALLMLVPAAIAAALQWPRVGLHAR